MYQPIELTDKSESPIKDKIKVFVKISLTMEPLKFSVNNYME